VAVGFIVHRRTADTFEPATPYSSLIVPTAQPWLRPADNLPGWPKATSTVFEVKESTRVTSFRFGPWPTVSRQTQEWSLADG
jgi:hypothetical protein